MAGSTNSLYASVRGMSHRTPWWALSAAIVVQGTGCGRVVRTQPDAAAFPTAITLTAGGLAGPLGGNGDVTFLDACASGQALTGFDEINGLYGSSIIVVGEIVGHCSSMHVGAATGADYATTATAGSALPVRGAGASDGVAGTLACPADQFVVGLAGHAGNALDQFALQCAPISLIANGAGWAAMAGVVTTSDAVGGSGGSAVLGLCPQDQVATISEPVVISSENLLGAISLGCSIVTAE